MKVLLTIWISAVLIQEVIPSTLVRLPRQASKKPSLVQTEYEAKYEQTGKHGNESSGLVSGKQEIVHDNCAENWNSFAEKCASLIKDLVASLANSVSSRPGDATKLQLQIKNTFRHFDNTHNCTCLNHTGEDFPQIDFSPLFNNLTITTVAPTNNNNGNSAGANNNGCGANGCNGGNGSVNPGSGSGGDNSGAPGDILVVQKPAQPNTSLNHAGVNPEDDDGSDSTNNSRRQAKYPQVSRQPGGNNSGNSNSGSPNNIKRAPYPFLVSPKPNSSATGSGNNNSPLGGNGSGSNGQSNGNASPLAAPAAPGSLLTIPGGNNQNTQPASDNQSKSVADVPVVLGDHDTEPVSDSRNSQNGAVPQAPVTGDNHDSTPIVPVVPITDSSTDSQPGIVAPLVTTGPTSTNSSPNPVTNNNTPLLIPNNKTPANSQTAGSNTPSNNQNNRPVVGVIQPETLTTPEGSNLGKSNHDPVINSDSNLPESRGQGTQGGTAYPLPTGPSSSVANGNSAYPESGNGETEQQHTTYAPTTTECSDSTSNGLDHFTSLLNDKSGVPESDNHYSGPSDGGNSGSSGAGATPVTVVPYSGGQNSDSQGGNGSGNGNNLPSQQGTAGRVYPVYTASTKSPLEVLSSKLPQENSGSNGGGNSGGDNTGGSNSASGKGGDDHETPCDDEGNNDHETATTPVIPLAVVSQPGGQGHGGPQSNGGSNGGQNGSEIPTLIDTAPAIDGIGSNGGSGSGSNGGSGNGSNGGSGNGSNGGSGNGSNGGPGRSPNNVFGSDPHGGTGSGSNGGSGSGPYNGNNGNGSDGTTPVIVYPVNSGTASPQTAGQTSQGNGSPQTNGGLGSNGGQNGSETPTVIGTTPITDGIGSNGGSGSGSNGGSGNGSNGGSGNGSNGGSGNGSNGGSGNGSNGGSGNGSNYGSGSSPNNVFGSDPKGGSGSGSNGGSGSGPYNGNNGNGSDGTTPVIVYPVNSGMAVPQSAGQTNEGSGGPQSNTGSGSNGNQNGSEIPSIGTTPIVISPVADNSANGATGGSGNGSNGGLGNGSNGGSGNGSNGGLGNGSNGGSGNGSNGGLGNGSNGGSGNGSNGGSGNGSNGGSGNAATTPVFVYPVKPVVTEPQSTGQSNKGTGGPQYNSNSGQPGLFSTTPIPYLAAVNTGDAGAENPTTFQTTSTDPTSPQSILLPTETAITSSTPHKSVGSSTQNAGSHDDDDDDEDCCSCESCTEEEITDPKQYKENACKNLEEARRELKAIFDKIKKKLKCGRKAPQTITTA